MIAVLDYGAGNLRSIQNGLDALGANYEIVRDADALRRATKIILPGVGHFGQMMRALDELNVREVLQRRAAEGIPFFGVCLGLHALFETSAEAPEAKGLGLLRGQIERFPATARVPHMGWNVVAGKADSRLVRSSEHFYFAHSFFAPMIEATSATCDYSCKFTAALEAENIFGVQFHPEKSGPAGLEIIRRFAEL